MDKVTIDGVECEGAHEATGKSNILRLRGRKRFMGGGCFDIAVAHRLGESLVVMRGVKNQDDMHQALRHECERGGGRIGHS